MKYYIEEQAWKEILSFFKKRNGIHDKNEEKIRQFIEAIWFVVRTGCQWCLLPDNYGCWYSIYRRFKRWVDKGIGLWTKSSKIFTNILLNSKIKSDYLSTNKYLNI